ncbi:carbohydrate ABC transporter permease [Ruminococcus sp. 5_1_39BFAA]|uniref:carbohydrate ABC transporter permease n=1 Tax=Ruminococcus sp. 5_1_39BFAA TaxID=457412 RepID=UPI003565D0F1
MKKKHHPMTLRRALRLLRYVPLILWVAFFGAALGWILFASFSTTKEIFTNNLLGSGFHFENYTEAWKYNNVPHYFMNSILVTGLCCALILLIASPAAYILAKKTFLGDRLVMNFTVSAMSIPQVMLIIPIYIWFIKANLVGHFITLIILYTTLNIPYTVFFMTSFFTTIPGALTEAAMIDGCTEGKAMWMIIMPMATPGLITVTIFNFMSIWNEYFIALIFANGNDKIRTLSMGLQNMITSMTFTGNWAGLFASIMIVFLPTFVLYLFLSDRIVAGITGGGVKG